MNTIQNIFYINLWNINGIGIGCDNASCKKIVEYDSNKIVEYDSNDSNKIIEYDSSVVEMTDMSDVFTKLTSSEYEQHITEYDSMQFRTILKDINTIRNMQVELYDFFNENEMQEQLDEFESIVDELKGTALTAHSNISKSLVEYKSFKILCGITVGIAGICIKPISIFIIIPTIGIINYMS